MAIKGVLAQTSLANMEERFTRGLGLAGNIETNFTADAKPVVLAEDLTRPGCTTFRNRSFMGSQLLTLTIGTNGAVAWRANNNLIIDQIHFAPRDASALPAVDFTQMFIQLMLAAPGTTPTFAVGTAHGFFCEVGVNNFDQPGLFTGNGGLWSVGFTIAQWTVGRGLTQIPTRIFLPAGAFMAMNFSADNAVANQSVGITVLGRVF